MSKRSRYLIERDNVARPRRDDGSPDKLADAKEQEALACVKQEDRKGALRYAAEAYILRHARLSPPITLRSVEFETLKMAYQGEPSALCKLRKTLLPKVELYEGAAKVEDALGALIVARQLVEADNLSVLGAERDDGVTLAEWALSALREALVDSEEAAAEYLEQKGVTITEETEND